MNDNAWESETIDRSGHEVRIYVFAQCLHMTSRIDILDGIYAIKKGSVAPSNSVTDSRVESHRV